MSFDPTDPDQAEAANIFRVAGIAIPGDLRFLTPAGTPRKWDVRKGVGLSGSVVVFVGLDVAKFKTRHIMSTSEHWTLWPTVAPIVEPPAQGVKPPILVVDHPLLHFSKITKAVIEDVVMPTPDEEAQFWHIDISWIGYRKPLPQIGTGTGAKGTQYQQTASDAGSQQIQALLGQLQGLTQ